MTELLSTWFSSVTPNAYGATFNRARVGRAFLGHWIWALLADFQRPLNSWETDAWAKAVRRNPREAIRAYNAGRADVDPDAVVRMLGMAEETRSGGEN